MPADESFDRSAEDRRPNTPSPAPRDLASASGASASLPDGEGLREGSLPSVGVDHPHPTSPSRGMSTRKIARQATSAVAYTGPTPDADDPLLSFAPYLHPHPRSNSITPERQRRFIATLAATGIVTQAARSIGKSMEALYKLRNKPGAEGFAAAWDAALERGVQRLEDCVRFLSGLPLRYLRPIARAEGRSQALRLFAPGHCVKCVRHPPSSSGSEAGH